MEHIKKQAENSQKLNDLIKKAMNDGEISFSDYDKIIMQAEADGVIDAAEQRILGQLQDMISSGVIRKVPG